MSIVFIISVVLIAIVLTAIAIHYFRTRYISDKWVDMEDALSPIVTTRPVSVVVVCHNEGSEMEVNIPKYFTQKGVDIEVIVVNAASYDTTFDAIKRLTLQYAQLRQTYLPTNNSQLDILESAHLLGARAARNEWVLYVSPTFAPPSDLWLMDLTRYAVGDVYAVIDYGNDGKYENSHDKMESKRSWKRRCKKMTQTVRDGRAIVSAGGSVMMKRSWVLQGAGGEKRRKCIYVMRRKKSQERLILQVQSRQPDFSDHL